METITNKNYHRLGDYIHEVNVRNTDLKVTNLLGLSIEKKFIPSIANTIGTDMSSYKIVQGKQFAYGPVTSRNGDKITIALLDEDTTAIISQAYTVFEIESPEQRLLPEYLIMWFRRPEFDRYARYHSHGSAREIFDWETMCDVMIPVPSIEEQGRIVSEYQTFTKRIEINNQLIDRLEDTAQAIYRNMFVDGIDKKNLPDGWRMGTIGEIAEIKGGKRLPLGTALVPNVNNHPYIKVADIKKMKYTILDDKFEYVDDFTQKTISRYIVYKDDLIISIVGTIGLVTVIDDTLSKANLTENCVKITNLKNNVTVDYLYHFFMSSIGKYEIETGIVGGVQGKLPIYNIGAIKILIPNEEYQNLFSKNIKLINTVLKSRVKENNKLTQFQSLLLSKLATDKNK